MLIVPSVGKLDHCLEELLYIAENDILGDVAEEKEVDKIASKMKETRKVKSFETLKLISQSITFSTHALKLLSHINIHIQKPLTPKKKVRLEKMLDHIAQGLECNPSAESDQLFIFAHGLIQDSISVESLKSQEGCEIQTNRLSIRDISYKGNSTTPQGSKNSHLTAVFALGVLHNRLKNMKLDKKDEQLLSMLDPFVSLLGDCLNSKYEDVLSGFRCLAPMIKLPLPSLEAQADKIKILLLDIAQKPGNANSLLVQSCLKLLTVLLRSTKITLSHDQLHMLIQFPVFIDLQTNPSPVALSLLKSVVGRKIVVHEIYDVVLRVGELMVTSQSEPIRKKCSQILLQFLLDYHLSDKRLQQHIDFFLTNLRQGSY
ncbi:small subunit processome component 20-like protein isoform X1 [Iris pallida]|uniref:Small subunit processome component 20-like protein isoform X1 n=1 Tax=Iris pallida TaxID=29817 RepID=A0AAX6I1Y2_IRIPA|nr:small subunit processome component 20-like protein isoform X1 [Iris pallida]